MVQWYYFVSLYLFLIMHISSSIWTVAHRIAKAPKSAATVLAQNLPKANYHDPRRWPIRNDATVAPEIWNLVRPDMSSRGSGTRIVFANWKVGAQEATLRRYEAPKQRCID